MSKITRSLSTPCDLRTHWAGTRPNITARKREKEVTQVAQERIPKVPEQAKKEFLEAMLKLENAIYAGMADPASSPLCKIAHGLAIDPATLCNPETWTEGVSRYLKFRSQFPQFDTSQVIKLSLLLSSGQALIDYFELLSQKKDLPDSLLEKHNESYKKLVDAICNYSNQRILDLFKEIGFTTTQTDFNYGLAFNYTVAPPLASSLKNDFLLIRKAQPNSGQGPLLPMERLIKMMKIPMEYQLADLLLGKIVFIYDCAVYSGPGVATSMRYEFIVIVQFVMQVNGTTETLPMFGFKGVYGSAIGTSDSLESAWDKCCFCDTDINDAGTKMFTLSEYKQANSLGTRPSILYLQEKINERILQMQRESVLSLLNSGLKSAAAEECLELIQEVDAQTRLFTELSKLTGRTVRELLLNELQSVVKIRANLEEFGTKIYRIDFLRRYFLDKSNIEPALLSNFTAPSIAPFMQDVQKQHQALKNLPNAERAEIPTQKDREILHLRDKVNKLEGQMRIVQEQNAEMLRYLKRLDGVSSSPSTRELARVELGGLPNIGDGELNAAVQALLASTHLTRLLSQLKRPDPLISSLRTIAEVKERPYELNHLVKALYDLRHQLMFSTQPHYYVALLNRIGNSLNVNVNVIFLPISEGKACNSMSMTS